MDLDLLRILVDFGLVVLIWLVQLVIYPSFLYADRERLVGWHASYTTRITVVVMPLMLTQVAVVGLQVLGRGALLDWLSAALVVAVWLLTFLRAVPLHGRIGEAADLDRDLPALVRWNWPRTILWTMVFVLGWASWLLQDGI